MENLSSLFILLVENIICLSFMFLVFIIIWIVVSINRIRSLELKVQEAESGIDVALTKRYDVLTKQMTVVKEYVSYESRTLFETIRLRSDMPMSEKVEMSEKMNTASAQLKLTAEQYPMLQSSVNFVQLQASITDVEEHLQAARRLYNSNVTAYNKRIVMFPSSVIAKIIGAKRKDLFEAETHKRQDVELKL